MLEPYEGKLSGTLVIGGRSGPAPLPLGATRNSVFLLWKIVQQRN